MQWPRPTCCSESSIALNGAKLVPCQGRAPCYPGLSLLFALVCPAFPSRLVAWVLKNGRLATGSRHAMERRSFVMETWKHCKLLNLSKCFRKRSIVEVGVETTSNLRPLCPGFLQLQATGRPSCFRQEPLKARHGSVHSFRSLATLRVASRHFLCLARIAVLICPDRQDRRHRKPNSDVELDVFMMPPFASSLTLCVTGSVAGECASLPVSRLIACLC
jgi:hypothetical protein